MGIVGKDHLLFQVLQDPFLGGDDLDRQHLLRFTPVQRQDPVPGRFCHGLFVVIVHLINGLGLLILGLRADRPLLHGDLPDVGPVAGIVGNTLRQDILCALDGGRGALHALFLIDVGGRDLL